MTRLRTSAVPCQSAWQLRCGLVVELLAEHESAAEVGELEGVTAHDPKALIEVLHELSRSRCATSIFLMLSLMKKRARPSR